MYSVDDANRELYSMLLVLKESHKMEVLSGKKEYAPFCGEFISMHGEISCRRAECRNYHKRNVYIMEKLCVRKSLLRRYLFNAEFDNVAFECLLEGYNHPSTPISKLGTLQYSADKMRMMLRRTLTDKQLAGITKIVIAHNMFTDTDITKEKVADLLNLKEGTQLKVANLQPVVLMFEEMMRMDVVRYGWQTALEKGMFLLNNKNQPIKASNLSSTLGNANANENDKLKKEIKLALTELFKYNSNVHGK